MAPNVAAQRRRPRRGEGRRPEYSCRAHHIQVRAAPDAKILAVPIDRLSTHYRHVDSLDGLPPELPAPIAHFFEHYKDLEPNKWVRIDGWDDTAAARTEILSSIQRFRDVPVKPHV